MQKKCKFIIQNNNTRDIPFGLLIKNETHRFSNIFPCYYLIPKLVTTSKE